MTNELQSQSNEVSVVKSNEIANRISDLERGGYYKNVVSPDDYLKTNKQESSTDGDTELYDDNKEQKESAAPLKHWSNNIKKIFADCTESQKKAWLSSFKIIEKGYVKNLNSLKDEIAQVAPIVKLLEPLADDLKKIGQSKYDYIKDLIDFDLAVGKDPAYEIAKLICLKQINIEDLKRYLPIANDDIVANKYINVHLDPLKKEIKKLKQALGDSSELSEDNELVKKTAEDAINKITMFFEQKDAKGNDLYPGAFENIEDILELVQTGENLEDAYNLVINGQSKSSDSSDTSSEIEYDELRSRSKKSVSAQEKERELLLATLNKISR